ncbi:MAG: PilZ domain-containing protein, partial [Alishewanella sp. 32-51-5]
PSWRIFHLSLQKTSATNSQSEFALPGTHSVQQTSPLLRGMLEPIYYIAALTDISSAEQRYCYTGQTYDASRLAVLNKFGLSKAAPGTLCEAIPIHYVNLRAESRYLYKTSVLVRTKPDSEPLTAFSRDFSSGGLQLEVSQPVNLQKGDIVLLDLPDLQKITLKHQLSRLPYEIMAVSKSRTIMNLKIAKADVHEGKQFFQQLIQSNRNKLTVAEETPKYPGLSDALRNMYLKSLSNFAIFVHRKGLRHDINVIGQGVQPNPLHRLLLLAQQEHNTLSFELLTKAHVLNHELANQLKQMKRQDPPKAYELYIRVAMVGGQRQLSSYFNFEFATEEELKLFEELKLYTLDTIEKHTEIAFRIFQTRKGKIDSEYNAKELGYISVYAIHKAKSLEEELWHVEGVADGVEISTEFVNRFAPSQSQAQQQQRQAILQTASALTS